MKGHHAQVVLVIPKRLVRQYEDGCRRSRAHKVLDVTLNRRPCVADGNALDSPLEPLVNLVVPVEHERRRAAHYDALAQLGAIRALESVVERHPHQAD